MWFQWMCCGFKVVCIIKKNTRTWLLKHLIFLVIFFNDKVMFGVNFFPLEYFHQVYFLHFSRLMQHNFYEQYNFYIYVSPSSRYAHTIDILKSLMHKIVCINTHVSLYASHPFIHFHTYTHTLDHDMPLQGFEMF